MIHSCFVSTSHQNVLTWMPEAAMNQATLWGSWKHVTYMLLLQSLSCDLVRMERIEIWVARTVENILSWLMFDNNMRSI